MNLFFQQRLVYTASKCHIPFSWQSTHKKTFTLAEYFLSTPTSDACAALWKAIFYFLGPVAVEICSGRLFLQPTSTVSAMLFCIWVPLWPVTYYCQCPYVYNIFLMFCSFLCDVTTKTPQRCLNCGILNVVTQWEFTPDESATFPSKKKKKKKCHLVKGLAKRLKKLINVLPNIYYRQILHLILSKSQSTFE